MIEVVMVLAFSYFFYSWNKTREESMRRVVREELRGETFRVKDCAEHQKRLAQIVEERQIARQALRAKYPQPDLSDPLQDVSDWRYWQAVEDKRRKS
jgi:hypothetical protein